MLKYIEGLVYHADITGESNFYPLSTLFLFHSVRQFQSRKKIDNSMLMLDN